MSPPLLHGLQHPMGPHQLDHCRWTKATSIWTIYTEWNTLRGVGCSGCTSSIPPICPARSHLQLWWGLWYCPRCILSSHNPSHPAHSCSQQWLHWVIVKVGQLVMVVEWVERQYIPHGPPRTLSCCGLSFPWVVLNDLTSCLDRDGACWVLVECCGWGVGCKQ